MRIVFLTDLHAVRLFLPALLRREAGADLCLIGGDFTNFRGESDARQMLAPLRDAFPRIRAVAGNTDRAAVSTWLTREGISLHGRGEEIDGLWVSGVSGASHSPLKTPTEFSEDEIAALLEAGAPPPEVAGAPWILVTHVPPADSVCDRIYSGKHVGSTALRRFLGGRAPTLNLCGHIHEGVGLDRVGTTDVCNPGAWTAARYAVITREGDHLQVDLRQLRLPRPLRIRATAQMMLSKVSGYARHRLRG